MQQEPTQSAAEKENIEDAAVLELMIHNEQQALWAFDEIEREMGRDPSDSLGRLYGAGLIHRLKRRYFWPTRAAFVGYEVRV